MQNLVKGKNSLNFYLPQEIPQFLEDVRTSDGSKVTFLISKQLLCF